VGWGFPPTECWLYTTLGASILYSTGVTIRKRKVLEIKPPAHGASCIGFQKSCIFEGKKINTWQNCF
jgi:hypothetical protein